MRQKRKEIGGTFYAFQTSSPLWSAALQPLSYLCRPKLPVIFLAAHTKEPLGGHRTSLTDLMAAYLPDPHQNESCGGL